MFILLFGMARWVHYAQARQRENLPIMDAREAARTLRAAAAEGKIAVVFGNEATGLTNDELSLANLGVMIPTAGHSPAPRKKDKYTGGAGPTSLNLSHAVGVLAYEMYTQMGEGRVTGFNSRLISVEERRRLADELVSARRSVDILRPKGSAGYRRGHRDTDTDGDGDGDSEGEREGVGDDAAGGSGGGDEGSQLSAEDRLLEEKEARAIASVLNAGPIATRDAAALFFLARRVQAAAAFSVVDTAVLDAAAVLYGEDCRGVRNLDAGEEAEGGAAGGGNDGGARNKAEPKKNPPSMKRLSNHIRGELGLSLTVRELERVARAVAGDKKRS